MDEECPEYPEVVSTWEYATMEMESLHMQLQHEKKRKHQIDNKLEETNTCIESKGISLDEEKSLLDEKSLKLEKDIDLLNSKISNAVEREKNAQICLSKEVFSDVSLKSIHQTCEQMRKDLMFKLTNDGIEMDATLKKMKDNNTNSETKSLRRKAFQLKEKIEHYELEMKAKAKVTSLFNILQAGISVDCQWHNAVQKEKELTTKIGMLDRELEEQPIPRLTEEKQQNPKYGDTIRDLKLEQEKELKTISTLESILSKIVLGQSCENENNTQEEQENVPAKQTTQTMYKRRSIKKIENSNERDDNTDKKEHKLEEVNSSGVEEKIEDIQIKTNNLKLTDESKNANNLQEDIPEKLSTQTINKIENIENDNEEEDDIDTEEHELQEVNPVKGAEAQEDDSQGKQPYLRLTDDRFQKEFGIIIESKYKKDMCYDAEPWHSNERLEVLESQVFPVNFKLYTDIFHISESRAENPHEGIRVPAKDIRIKLLLPIENSSYYEYKVAIKVGKNWTLIDYSIQDGFMVFEADHVESFCVLSLEREEKHIILPAGSQFISEIDNRIQVFFPPGAVTIDEHITFKIYPANISCILTRTTDLINNSISINAITPGISTSHMNFKKMFKVQLPLDSITDLCGNTEDNICYIFKINDDGSLKSTDLRPSVKNGIVCFEVNSFSGYCGAGTTRSNSKSSIVPTLQESYGFRKWCKILFFVGTLKNYALPIMLECVNLDRVLDVRKEREIYGYQNVPECTSRDVLLSPNKTIITVDVKGIFRIPIESCVKHPRLSFCPPAKENFTRFQVELKIGRQIKYGMIVLREQNKTGILDEIYYHPVTTKKIIPAKIRVNKRKDHVVTEQPSMAPNQNQRDFFTEKGLLALSKSMSPDTMLEVCLYMDMTIPIYERIRKKYANIILGEIALLKAALHQQPHGKELENLIKALIKSGQQSLADNIHQLHSKGEPLHHVHTI